MIWVPRGFHKTQNERLFWIIFFIAVTAEKHSLSLSCSPSFHNFSSLFVLNNKHSRTLCVTYIFLIIDFFLMLAPEWLLHLVVQGWDCNVCSLSSLSTTKQFYPHTKHSVKTRQADVFCMTAYLLKNRSSLWLLQHWPLGIKLRLIHQQNFD